MTRRLFNQAFFEKLWVDEKVEVRSELAQPFKALLGSGIKKSAMRYERRANAKSLQPVTYCREKAGTGWREALTVARGDSFADDGFSNERLVALSGRLSNHAFRSDLNAFYQGK